MNVNVEWIPRKAKTLTWNQMQLFLASAIDKLYLDKKVK